MVVFSYKFCIAILGQVAHGERMEKGEEAAAETVEDEDKDTTIVLSDEEVEQFVTVTKKKRKKQEEEKKQHLARIYFRLRHGSNPRYGRYMCNQCETEVATGNWRRGGDGDNYYWCDQCSENIKYGGWMQY